MADESRLGRRSLREYEAAMRKGERQDRMDTTEQDLYARSVGNFAFGRALLDASPITARTPVYISGGEPWMLAVTTDPDDFTLLEEYVEQPFRFRRYIGVAYRRDEHRIVFTGEKDWLYILMRTVALDLASARIDLRPAADVVPPVTAYGCSMPEEAGT